MNYSTETPAKPKCSCPPELHALAIRTRVADRRWTQRIEIRAGAIVRQILAEMKEKS